jgi:hypothetical protein
MTTRTRTGLAACALAAAMALVSAAAASADIYRDRVHADSFGNLVIYSAAGYKRIIVGMGEAADGYNATGSYYEPETPSQPSREDAQYRYGHGYHGHGYKGCGREPVLLHGRSHMYGLPANVIPVPAGLCK